MENRHSDGQMAKLPNQMLDFAVLTPLQMNTSFASANLDYCELQIMELIHTVNDPEANFEHFYRISFGWISFGKSEMVFFVCISCSQLVQSERKSFCSAAALSFRCVNE